MKNIAILVSSKVEEKKYLPILNAKEFGVKFIYNISDFRYQSSNNLFSTFIVDSSFLGKKEAIFQIKQLNIKSILVSISEENSDFFVQISDFNLSEIYHEIMTLVYPDFYKEDSLFTRIDHEMFFEQNKAPFDLFIKLNNNKTFMRISKENHSNFYKVIENFQEKGINDFFTTNFSYNQFRI